MAASSPTGSSSPSSVLSSLSSSTDSTSSSLQFHVSISSEENSLDPKTRWPNSVNVFQRPPRVRIVGFKLPEPSSGSSPISLLTLHPVPPALPRRPGLCIRGPLGMPMPIEPIEKLRRPPRVRSLLTEALRGPYSYPEPPYSGTLWPRYQGLQICRTWV